MALQDTGAPIWLQQLRLVVRALQNLLCRVELPTVQFPFLKMTYLVNNKTLPLKIPKYRIARKLLRREGSARATCSLSPDLGTTRHRPVTRLRRRSRPGCVGPGTVHHWSEEGASCHFPGVPLAHRVGR